MTVKTYNEANTLNTEAPPAGPAWAALLSASVGGAAFGLLTDASECSARASKALNLYNPSGSLSGVAIVAVAIWAVVWAILHVMWKNKHPANQGRLTLAVVFLVLVAIVTTFPPFYELFAKGG
jgi:hypothetical protein